MSKLYIIGNGFDRYHGLDTKYQSFGFFLKRNNSELYELLINYFGLPDIDEANATDHNNPLWSTFEAALAELDWETVLSDNSDYLPNIADDDFRERDRYAMQIEMEGIVANLTSKMVESFAAFIREVQFPASIDDRLVIDPNSHFFQFNYTDTLERCYKVKHGRILYIHKSIHDKEHLVLGHGVNPDQFKEKKKVPPPDLSEDDLSRWYEQMADDYDYSWEIAKQELLEYFTASHKNTARLINENTAFFSAISVVTEVIILGHSLSDVDLPYFRHIYESIVNKDIPWTVTYYSDAEADTFFGKLIDLGIDPNLINLVKMADLKFNPPSLF